MTHNGRWQSVLVATTTTSPNSQLIIIFGDISFQLSYKSCFSITTALYCSLFRKDILHTLKKKKKYAIPACDVFVDISIAASPENTITLHFVFSLEEADSQNAHRKG